MAEGAEEMCTRKPTKCLKVPLKSTEQIYLIFLIPAIASCLVYVLHFAADLVVAVQHFREENPVWACITIGFMYAPALAYFILTISRPDWWMTDDDKLYKGAFLWFLLQLIKLIAFPLFALYRYAGLIVLSIDAIMLSGEQRRKTLNVAAAPAAIELYFFLQAWFQAAPQAVFQTHLLFREKGVDRTHQSEVVHMLCILMSICIMAMRTTSFQRYESQRLNGRKVPWAMWLKKYRIQELENLEEKQLLQSTITSSQAETAEATNKPDTDKNSSGQLERQNSMTPPLPPKNVKIIPPPAPLRGITSITPLAVPDMPAPPRPDSLVVDPEDVKLDQIPKSSSDDTTNDRAFERSDSLKIPKRKNFAKGLENDDPVGIFLAFVWWFLFILPRVLSIAIFYEFYPLYLLAVLGVHYVCMIGYLFYYAKYYDVMSFFINLWLGLVYVFSIIEYRIKFKYADKWLIFYYIFVILQNTFMTMFWYFYGNWDGFWYSYSFHMIFICMSLCLLSTIVYYLMLKPKKRRIYVT
ncbi:hypothetical protein TSAR_011729 [Trichomalopsis sarcophagae]|uniref:XK-related protein n=1 Tax=Trichomalopsis sarcophagae TaxID=543379 RepID=A0A232FCN2_9HYME|nr:hypothetical protein TSAR_011729 [Trichomalopsis sarcophagae]